MRKYSSVSVIGLGYIGLPSAAMIAGQGVRVHGVDINQNAVDTINQGRIHIVEPDLEALVEEVVGNGNLSAATTVQATEAYIIAVPTPFRDGHLPDLSFVEAATRSIAPHLRPGCLVILESTSPVGTTERLSQWMSEMRPDLKFPHQARDAAEIQLAYCPERVLPGNILRELVDNDRVIGGMTVQAAQDSADLYRVFLKGQCILTNARTAEMVKLTENSFRDVNIAFANELSLICDKLGINVWDLIRFANHHPRVKILQPGPGVGGHCIAVDPWFIVSETPEEARLIRTAREVNDGKPSWVIGKVHQKIEAFLAEHLEKEAKDVTVVCYGLSFKPDVDDLRESPALSICKQLASTHAGQVLAVEPNVAEIKGNPNFRLVSREEGDRLGDVAVLLVDHKVFRGWRPRTLHQVDTKGIW